MSIAPAPVAGASSVGAAPARDPVHMPLLRSLAVFFAGFYRHGAPTALRNLRRRQGVFQQAGRAALVALSCVLAPGAFAQDDEPPAPPKKDAQVRIAFLPPPMEGALSLGIYDPKGRLVRVLHREAVEKDFAIGLNGLITHWDGADDAGKPLPAGTYEARGYSVGAVQVDGVALHGNDWITDDDTPRFARMTDLRADGIEQVNVVLKTLDGAETRPIRFATEQTGVTAPAVAAKVAEGKVTLTEGDQTRAFPLAEGEMAVDASVGERDLLWLIVKTAGSAEVRAYTLAGEFLRHLSYTPDEPQPRRIVASRWEERIVLLEESTKMQRVRSLVRATATSPGEAAWKTTLERTIWLGDSFDAVKDQLQRPGGKPFAPEKEFVVKLINNPLLKDEPTTARVNIGFDDRGSFLQTTDGLPLRRITETPHLRWAAIGREGSGKLLTILQGDGAVVEEFRASKLANMMAFDAGGYEWAGK